MTRGERNNNPGNIREGVGDHTHWKGERTSDDDLVFEEFKTPEDGIRALGKVLLNYYRQHGLGTVRGIIQRWAPVRENNTSAYIKAVAGEMGRLPDEEINVEDPIILFSLVRAIIHHENGRVSYANAVIQEGVRRALV